MLVSALGDHTERESYGSPASPSASPPGQAPQAAGGAGTVHAAPAGDARRPGAPRRPARRAGERPRLLLAEDNPINQRVAGLILEKLGYDHDVVASGDAAVRAVASTATPPS